jgi:hypothetical protein
MLNSHFRQCEPRRDCRAVGRHLRLLGLVAVLVTSAANGAEHRDHSNTGWEVAAPRAAEGQVPLDFQQRMILDAIFSAHTPLLAKPASPQPKPAPAAPSDMKRVAVRPDGVDGWRPASSVIVPQGNSLQVIPSVPGASPDAAVLPHEKPIVPTPDAEPVVEKSSERISGRTKPPISVQFRAPRFSRPVPTNPSTKTNQKDGVASEFDVEGVPQPDVDSKAPAPKTSPTSSVAGPAIDAPTNDQIADSPDTAHDHDVPAVSLPPAQVTAPLDTMEPVDAVPEDSSDQSTSDRPEEQSTEPAPPVVEPPPPLTRQLVNLRSRVRSVLNGYYRKTLNSREHDPWEVMHGMLAYGVKSRVRQGGPRGELITSVGWLCYNKPCKGLTMMHVTREGELRAKYGVGLQGHLGQLLAMLAQCHVSADYPIRVGGHEFTIHDLVDAEKKTCYPKSELTFKLLAFQYYLDLNDQWVNDQGLQWDFPRLIREELAQPIRGAACGGTHRLSSLSLTVKARVRRGEPLDGEYARAAEFVQKYHQYAFRLQNRDGSLSTAWFNGRGDESDINRRIKTTGHILEWLCYSLSDEELRDQRTIRAVTYLANLMYSNYDNEWEVGPMCHATHALLLYDERIFQPHDQPGYAAPYRAKPASEMGTRQATRR